MCLLKIRQSNEKMHMIYMDSRDYDDDGVTMTMMMTTTMIELVLNFYKQGSICDETMQRGQQCMFD